MAGTAAMVAALSYALHRAIRTSPTSHTKPPTGRPSEAKMVRARIASGPAVKPDHRGTAGNPGADRDRGYLLRDLKGPGDQVIVARGGKRGTWQHSL